MRFRLGFIVRQSLQFAVTVVIVIATFGALKVFQNYGNMSPGKKTVYLGIITALSLVLALNFFDAFKTLARVSPARLEKLTWLPSQEFEGIEDWSKVGGLAWRHRPQRRKSNLLLLWIFAGCVIWILFFLAAQTTIALLNVEIQVIDGTNYNDTYLRSGTVRVPDLSCYWHYIRTDDYLCGFQDPDNAAAQCTTQSLAHNFGEDGYGALTPLLPCGSYNDTAEILESTTDYRYYCRRTPNQQEFSYRFKEYNPDDLQNTYPYFTSRIITASSGPCFEYNQTSAELQDQGILAMWNYGYSNGTASGKITIPTQVEALSGTTYVYRDANLPQIATDYSCGSRCMWIWAHKNPAPGLSDNVPKFYQCPISLSTVSNVTDAAHNVTDDMARLAVSSIAVQGHASIPPYNWTQWQFYAIGNPWEILFKPLDEIGANMAEFAIASISTMNLQNKQIDIPATLPSLGSHLEFQWSQAFALLVPIAAAHFLLLVLIIEAELFRRRKFRPLSGSDNGANEQELQDPADDSQGLVPPRRSSSRQSGYGSESYERAEHGRSDSGVSSLSESFNTSHMTCSDGGPSAMTFPCTVASDAAIP